MAERNYVTIVSGLPRSGTSMMMKMLSEGGIPALVDNIREADVDNPKGYFEFEPVKKTKEDASWLQDAPGKVVKMVYQLLYDLPDGYEYRVVFMRRHLDEVIKSQDVMLQRRGKQAGALPAEKLKALFLDEITKCLTWMNEQPHFHCVEVHYNEVLADAGAHIARLNEFLDGSLDTAAMQSVVDQSLYRQRKE